MADTYLKLAEIYPYVMRKVRYDRWSEYLYYLTREFVTGDPKVLELAAGNCSFTNLFSEYYPDIIAADLSLAMLSSAHCNLIKVCCDMTKLPFKGKFDFIYSTFDSINYLTSRSKLLSLFKEINKIISDNGIFTFDVSMEKNSYKHAEDPVRSGKYNGFSYVHKSEYNPSTMIHKNSFIITDPEGNKFREVHRQKIYPFELYFDLIPRAGLYVAACYKAFSFVKGNKDSERLQFILKKAGKNAAV